LRVSIKIPRQSFVKIFTRLRAAFKKDCFQRPELTRPTYKARVRCSRLGQTLIFVFHLPSCQPLERSLAFSRLPVDRVLFEIGVHGAAYSRIEVCGAKAFK
jgi:hypothetical protein